jgi:hypothetical protein
MSFLLDSFDSLSAARGRAEELRALQVPAYVLRREGDAGEERFDVWAGAFADATEAGYLGQILEVNGLASPLVARTGEQVPE